MLQLTAADLQAIRQMKDFGLLKDVEFDKLQDIKEPTCLITCSDGHQRGDINSYLSRIWQMHNAEEFIHEFKDNGLPLMAVPSKLVDPEFKRPLILLNSIKDGLKMGKIRSRIISLGHYPCGVGNLHRLSVEDSIELLIAGRKRIMSELSNHALNITVALQVDFRSVPESGKTQNTYHVDTSVWADYKQEFGYSPTPSLYGKSASAR